MPPINYVIVLQIGSDLLLSNPFQFTFQELITPPFDIEY
jgi:hypothetical protein